MKDQIKDLIYSIANQDASSTEDMLNNILSQKAVEAIDARRVEVAQSMFTQPEHTEE